MTEHKTRRYGDQMVCTSCGRQWDVVDNDPPPCALPDPPPEDPEKFTKLLERINEDSHR